VRVRVGVVPQLVQPGSGFTFREPLGLRALLRLPDATLRSAFRTAGAGGLEQKARAPIGELSRHEAALTLARALINDPELIVMDEPTTGLDPQARHLIWERLKGLLAAGRTMLLTTHFMDEAQRLADRLAVIDHGRKICEGAPAN